jgi:hypothetical protein
MTLIELLQNRRAIQKESGNEMKARFEAHSLELQEVLIGTPRAAAGDLTIENILLQLRSQAIGTANAQATKLSVDAHGGPEYRLAEQNFSRFADALTRINQPLVPQFLMSGAQGQENNGGPIPTAMLGRMMPDAPEKLKEEAPKTQRRGNGP